MKILGWNVPIDGLVDMAFGTIKVPLAELKSLHIRFDDKGKPADPASISGAEKWNAEVKKLSDKLDINKKNKDGSIVIPSTARSHIDQISAVLADKAHDNLSLLAHVAKQGYPGIVIAEALVAPAAAIILDRTHKQGNSNPAIFGKYLGLHGISAKVTVDNLESNPGINKETAIKTIVEAAFADIDLFLSEHARAPGFFVLDSSSYAGIHRILSQFERLGVDGLSDKCQRYRSTILDRAIKDANLGVALEVLQDAEMSIRARHKISPDTLVKMPDNVFGAIQTLQDKVLGQSQSLIIRASGDFRDLEARKASLALSGLHSRMMTGQTCYDTPIKKAGTQGCLFDMAATIGNKSAMQTHARELQLLVEEDPKNAGAAAKLDICRAICAKHGVELAPPQRKDSDVLKTDKGSAKDAVAGLAGPSAAGQSGEPGPGELKNLLGRDVEGNAPGSGRAVVGDILGAVIDKKTAEAELRGTIGIVKQQLMAPDDIRRGLAESAIGTAEYSRALNDLVEVAKQDPFAFPDLERIANVESLKMRKSAADLERADQVNMVQAASIAMLRKNPEPSSIEKLVRACRARIGLKDASLGYAFRQATDAVGVNKDAALASFGPALAAANNPIKVTQKVVLAVAGGGNQGNSGNG